MSDEHATDLFWHALNYRGAAPQHAQAAWIELEACVQRLISREELGRKLNPLLWTREESNSWHRAIPDVQKAFGALRGDSFYQSQEENNNGINEP